MNQFYEMHPVVFWICVALIAPSSMSSTVDALKTLHGKIDRLTEAVKDKLK